MLLFHGGYGVANGGFVGVDIFFVISGYLIIGHIVEAKKSNQFSHLEFYYRRSLRIIPPYLLVILSTLCLGIFVLIAPADFNSLWKQTVASALMLSNHYFANHQGYFDPASEDQPLLHLWSLGVEEQFYVFVPLIISTMCYAEARIWRGDIWFRTACVLMFIMSLALCVSASSGGYSNEAFFYMPLRGWEFIAGGMTTYAVREIALPPRLSQATLCVGVALMLSAIFWFSAEMTYPSVLTLLPVLGACLTILGGEGSRADMFHRFISIGPIAGLATISYSLYLWHWPLLVFARIANFGELPVWLAAMAEVLALCLAILTYYLVEGPIKLLRISQRAKRGRSVFLACFGCGFAALVAVGYGIAARDWTAHEKSTMNVPLDERSSSCDLLAPGGTDVCLGAHTNVGLILGDSHAAAAYPQLHRIAQSAGAALVKISFGGCSPFIGISRTADLSPSDCSRKQKEALEVLAKVKIDFAILDAQWMFHDSGLISNKGFEMTQHDIFVAGVKTDLEILRRTGAKRILVVGPVPLMKSASPWCLMRADAYGLSRDARCSENRIDYDNKARQSISWLRSAISEESQATVLDVSSTFCDHVWCRAYVENDALYLDHSHLSSKGVEVLYEKNRRQFDWVFGRSLSTLNDRAGVFR
ncbi:acyltransferase [Mesorhizobium sp. M0913]